MPNQPSSDALHRELYTLRQRTKLLPKATAVLGRVSLLADSFLAGWIIGTTIHKVFLSSEIPAQSAAVYYASPVEGGSTIPGSPINELVAPADGWYGQGSCGAPGCLLESSEYQGQCTEFGPLEAEPPGWSWVSAPQYFTFNCGTVILRSMPFRASPVRVDEYAGQTPTQPSVTWPTSSEGTNGEATTVTRDRMRSELENNPGSYPILLPWLDAHLGGDSEDPTGQLVKIPGCRGDSYEACANRLTAAGLTPQRVELSADGADLNVAPGLVVRTDPGKQARPASEVEIYVNPSIELIRVPVCRGDSYEACVSQLEAAGLTAQRTELTFGNADLDVLADRVTRTNPANNAVPGSEVKAYVNPPVGNMPIRVPAFSTDQTSLSYADDLRATGLTAEIREAPDEVVGGAAGTVQSTSPSDRALPQQKVSVYVDPYGPPTADNEIPECRVSTPTGLDPAPSRGGLASWPDQWTSPIAMALAFQPYRTLPFTRNVATGGPTTVVLQWGAVIRVVLNGKSDWKGFGYRKIKTKHGWSQEDDDATQQALLQPGIPAGSNFEHVGATVRMPNGSICYRVVIVQTEARPNEPAAREMLTSYGKLSK